MGKEYIFRRIERHEIPEMFQLILDRIKWMDEQKIEQWNVTEYHKAYPQSYYEEQWKLGRLFILAEKSSNELVCAAVLTERDGSWDDGAPAIYLHSFVSKVGERGVGSIFLSFVEEYALSNGKQYLRLDSARDNQGLGNYYGAHGFLPVGTCTDGPYRGVLRQKKLF